MAHATLRALAPRALTVFALTTSACAETTTASDATKSAAAASATTSGFDEGRSGRYHSARFDLSLVLPGGKQWTVDDHRAAALAAVHPLTSSRLELQVFALDELTNHQRCEIEARARSLVPPRLSVLDESDEGGPAGFDTHVIVGVEPGKSAEVRPASSRVVGHVLAFAASVHRCLIFDFSSEVPAGAEATLGDRLAVGITRILPTVTLDPSRIQADSPAPERSRPRN